MEHIMYPTGRFNLRENYTLAEIEWLIQDLEIYPKKYSELVSSLSKEALSQTYREGGWNIAQLVHHVADMQLLHYFRMKKALTEPGYSEATQVDMNGWASLPDALSFQLEDSLRLFSGVHARYVQMARHLKPEQLEIQYYHPGRKIYLNQKQALAMSAWHVRHHYGHIELALKNPFLL